jgi:PAS domain S-box-containing protein
MLIMPANKKTVDNDLKDIIQRHFREFLNNIKEAIYIIDDRGYIRYVNKYVETMGHYKASELVGRHFTTLVAPESMKAALASDRDSRAGRSTKKPFELVLLDKNGARVHIKTTESPLKLRGKYIGTLGMAADITEFRKTTSELSKTIKDLTLLYSIGNELISIMNPEAVFKRIIYHLKHTFGYERVAILLFDESTNELIIRAAEKPYPAAVRRLRIKPGVGITGNVALTGKPYLSNDVRREKRYLIFDRRTRSEVCVPLKIYDIATGVINIESYKPNMFDENDIKLLTIISQVAAIAIENSRLYASLENSYLETIKALVSAVEAKDPYTKGHSQRVRRYAIQIARHLDLTVSEQKELNYAGYLHDIGKIGISDFLLTKPTSLTTHEYELMKEHPNIGYNMIRDIRHLTKASYIIRSEHEKFDGTGYPNGLRKHEIPIGARIIAVADAYDAMTTYRPYRKALSKKEAIKRLKENAGSQFDPRIVSAFLKAIRRDTLR